MTRFSAQDELPRVTTRAPSNLAATSVELLPALCPLPERDRLPETPIDDQRGQRVRLITSPPAAPSSAKQAGAIPQASFFICHTMRCGSTLLCDALSNTGVAGHPEEYFPERLRDGSAFVRTGAALNDPATWRLDWTSAAFEKCLHQVLTSGTTPNGVFSSKVKWPNIPYLGEMLGALPDRGARLLAEQLDGVFPNLRYVWITRRDKVRQAVSLVKARQSAQWKEMTAQPQRSHAADYNFHIVELALRRIVEEECSWEEYFTQTGITPFTVVYEDLVRNYETTARRLLDHLEIDLPNEYQFPAPRLRKQADAESDDWVDRYYRHARSRRTWHTVASLPALVLRRRLRHTYVRPRLRIHVHRLRGRHRRLESA